MQTYSKNEKPINSKSKFQTLIFQVGGPFIVFTVIFFLIMFFSIRFALNKTYTERINSPINTINNLTNYINREISALNFNASNIAYIAGKSSTELSKEYSQKILNLRPQILKIEYYGNDKKLIWDTSSLSGLSLGSADNINIIPSKVFVEDYFDKSQNVYLHRVQYPVINGKEKLGVIEIIYDTTYLWDTLLSYDAKYIYIIDNNGEIILSKNELNNINSNYGNELLKKYSNQTGSVINSKDPNGLSLIGVAQPVDSRNWTIVVENSLNDEINTSRNMVYVSALLLFLLTFLLVLEIIIIRKKVFMPLKSLKDMSYKISNGDYNSCSNTLSNNEFDIISMALNQVVFNIRSLKEDFNEKLISKTNSLSEKIKDSEIIGSFMINRELKMAELKSENKKLLDELKKYRGENNSLSNENDEK